MGQNRQQLRDRLESELRNKIAAARTTLTDCKVAQISVEHNAAQAKLQVLANFDSMTNALVSRKDELTKEIDLLSQTQANSLQTHIQSTYLLLGSLQSTLSNLDSFEHGQLLNVQMQDDTAIQNIPLSLPLKTNVDCEQLKTEINAWGTVTAQGQTEIVDVWTSASSDDDSEMKNDFVFMSHESIDSAPENVQTNVVQTPSLPHPHVSIVPKNWNCEQWLLQMKNDKCTEDFEVLSLEQEAEQAFGNMQVVSSSNDCVVPDMELLADASEEHEKTSRVSTDEIDVTDTETESELSKWLKPRKRQCTPSVSSNSSILGGIQNEIMETRKVSKVATKNRFLEYPGLRLDPNCWLHRGTSKGLDDLFSLSDDVSMTLNQKEIIPPTYALPYPFWLKRC